MFEINKFKSLPKEKKISKLISMLEIVKGDSDLFNDLYQLINNLKNSISHEFLDTLYSTIASAVKNLNNSKFKKDIEKMGKIRQRLRKLKELEEKEKDNPENILKQIGNI